MPPTWPTTWPKRACLSGTPTRWSGRRFCTLSSTASAWRNCRWRCLKAFRPSLRRTSTRRLMCASAWRRARASAARRPKRSRKASHGRKRCWATARELLTAKAGTRLPPSGGVPAFLLSIRYPPSCFLSDRDASGAHVGFGLGDGVLPEVEDGGRQHRVGLADEDAVHQVLQRARAARGDDRDVNP